MFGQNKISFIEKHSGDVLEVVEIFKTLQGEGIFAGRPAIFIRLAGCNLKCSFCDTEFDKFQQISLPKIVTKAKNLAKGKVSLIVITGGEPLRQPIEKLCQKLIEEEFQIQIETNGTIRRTLPKEVMIVCSPKETSENQYQISEELIEFVDMFKFIVRSKGSYSKLPKLKTNKQIFVQPMDEYDQEKNHSNLKRAIELAFEHNYILSLQQHKILNLP